ncbi:MAG: nucleotidyl transferase AbiEii/AbiGii toxin family protein [Desulfobacterales bacterium]|nr:nucleotidyl transferase AbiEii/AbiGii toxin family protein [Desulfobacterales bacterium]
MNDAVRKMLERYPQNTLGDQIAALREILQEIALLGLWRAKFFEKAAFYGGTALRVLYGLDRFSEDLDFSLLTPMGNFDLTLYLDALRKEVAAFGFDVRVEGASKESHGAIRSAFLKANTIQQLLVIEADENGVRALHREQVLKIKIEVDTDPPAGFDTETRYLLNPIPFAVKSYALPDLFAGKMHALLCRRWKSRSKGRDWYDLIWYAAHHPHLHLAHLEQRMRQSGDWKENESLSPDAFKALLHRTIESLDVQQARKEVEPFVKHPEQLTIWSGEFFRQVTGKIAIV